MLMSSRSAMIVLATSNGDGSSHFGAPVTATPICHAAIMATIRTTERPYSAMNERRGGADDSSGGASAPEVSETRAAALPIIGNIPVHVVSALALFPSFPVRERQMSVKKR